MFYFTSVTEKDNIAGFFSLQFLRNETNSVSIRATSTSRENV